MSSNKNYINGIQQAYVSIYTEAAKNVDITKEQAAALAALINKAIDGDQDAINVLTGKDISKVEQAVNSSNQDEPVTEAFEKLRAKIGSKIMGDDPIKRRYDLFLKDVNGHLWEVKNDARKLNVQPDMVDGFISKIIDIEPQVQEKGKLLQKVGYMAGSIVGRFAFASPFVLAATALGPIAGITGLGIPALASALAGGGKLLTLLQNKQLSKKEKFLDVVSTMVSAWGLTNTAQDLILAAGKNTAAAPVDPTSKITYDPKEFAASGKGPVEMQGPPSSAAGEAPPSNYMVNKLLDAGTGTDYSLNGEIANNIKKDWVELTGTKFGRLGRAGAETMLSRNDNAILQQILDTIKAKGIDWSKLSELQKGNILNPIAKSVLRR